MTSQAKNSIALYKGGNPSTIESLLNFQKASVVNELMAEFNAHSKSELAIKLSLAV